MYLDILHVFYTYLKRVQDTCRIHIRYIRIHVSWTLHHDTSRYTEIHEAAEASKAPKAPKAAAKAAKAAAMAPKESPRRASTRGRK